jgi:DUF2946 family protein
MGVVAAMRRRLDWLLPLALFALLLQIAAPIDAARFAAGFADPLRVTEICHSDPDAAPAPAHQRDHRACGIDCLLCCVVHGGGALDASRAPTLVVPRLEIVRVAWLGAALLLARVQARSNAQPRAPPILS